MEEDPLDTLGLSEGEVMRKKEGVEDECPPCYEECGRKLGCGNHKRDMSSRVFPLSCNRIKFDVTCFVRQLQ